MHVVFILDSILESLRIRFDDLLLHINQLIHGYYRAWATSSTIGKTAGRMLD